MQILKRSATFLIAFLSLLALFPADMAYAASTHTITLLKADETKLSTVKISNGMSIGNLPDVNDLLVWVDELGNVITSETIPASDMIVKAVTKEDVLSHGTLDNGNIIWFILDGHLYVTGTGKIGTIPEYKSTGSTKKYGFSIGDIQVEPPAVMYDWLYKPSVGDEQTTGYGAFKIPDNPVRTVSLNISRPLSITGQTIGYPHSTMSNYIPWKANAKDITAITFAETVKLSGNFTLYFNANSASVIPSELKESIYSNLEYIYMFADTSDVVQMAGMYARIPHLKGIYTLSGNSYHTENCWDMAGMFYGNENFTCNEKNIGNHKLISIINVFSDVSNVEDMRYMLFACKSLKQPSIGNWNTSSLKDTSYMAAGCTNLQLTLAGTAKPYDLGNWDMTNVYSTTGMFAGSNIDLTSSNPVSNLWGMTNASVISGKINLDLWDLSSLQVSVFMFAQNHTITDVIWTAELPLLRDTSAMFAFCKGLNSVYFVNLDSPLLSYIDVMFFSAGSSDGTADLSGMNLSVLRESRYAFYGTGFKKINLDKTNPEELLNAEGMFAQNKNLTSLGKDALSGWNLPKLKLILAWNPVVTESISAMFKNTAKLTTLNLSGKNFSKVSNYANAFAGNKLLTNATIPADFFSGVKNSSSGIKHTFFVEDDTLTYLTLDISSTSIPNKLAAYDWLSDNRTFILEKDAYITEKEDDSTPISETAYTFSETGTDKINLHYDVVSTFFTGDTPVPISFSWKNGDNSISNASGSKYSVSRGNIGTYTATASLQALKNADTLSQQFQISQTSGISKLSAEYTGKPVVINGKYSFDDLSVFIYFADGTKQPVKKEDIKTDQETILTVGDNTFHVYYTDIDNHTWSASFTVTGYRPFVSIEAEYIGKPVMTGNNFKEKEVVVTAYYIDDPAKTQGIKITPTSFNSLTVTEVGNNTFTVYYKNESTDNIELSDTFTVSGYVEKAIDSVTASYNGDKIAAGSCYDKSNVTVTLNYNDNTTEKATVFTVDSLLVKNTGVNIFTATYTDIKGNVYHADFNVEGIALPISYIKAVYKGKDIAIGNSYSKEDVAVTVYYSDGTSKETGTFSVNNTKVTAEGRNTFTASIADSNGKSFTADFTVNGYSLSKIASIEAAYNGPDILVGQTYNTNDVIVTITFTDGKTAITITDFTVDASTVTNPGNNTFTAFVLDAYGNKFSDSFIVNGIGNTDSGNSTNNPGSNLGVQTGESNDLLGVCLCLAGFILLFIVLLYFIIKDRKKGQQK